MKNSFKFSTLFMIVAILLAACGNSAKNESASRTMQYSLKTAMMDGKMVFIGVGGGIDGVQNPV